MKKKKLINYLPHRDPFLFVDWCEIIEIGKEGVGYRKFLPEEYFFRGHFPNSPIVPGVILVEALAQTAGVLLLPKGLKINQKNQSYLQAYQMLNLENPLSQMMK